MFTGIIEAIGTIKALQPAGEDLRIRIRSETLAFNDVQLGDSIAVNGVCLTVVDLPGDGFWADVSGETLAKTCVGQWQQGYSVNLEKALTPTTRLGGHLVSGHVDGIATVKQRWQDGRSWRFEFKVPDELARYIAQKGSITIDGTSLTVNAVRGALFEVNIVPHTLEQTIMGHYQQGTQVNIEVDLLARYLERLLLGEQAANADAGIDKAFLQEHGFMKS
jgi:riboflavin synthase